MAATVCGISFAVTACSSDNDSDSDNNKKQEEKQEDTLTPKLVGLWVTDYAESGSEGSKTWTRVVEDYRLNADGTGYYECYLLNGDKYVDAESVRDIGHLHFTTSDNIIITGDEGSAEWKLAYADDKLMDAGDMTYARATAEQQTLVDRLYTDWQGGNSGNDNPDNNNLNTVNSNVDVNTGGGVNVVR